MFASRRSSPVSLVPLLAVLVGVATGCHPSLYEETERASREVVLPAADATGYWQRTDVPPLGDSEFRRVAIVELTVEFVTERLRSAGETERARFSEDAFRYVPDLLQGQVENHLEVYGIAVAPRSDVGRSQAFGRYRRPGGAAVERPRSSPAENDLGRVVASRMASVAGLGAVTGTAEEVRTCDAALRQELGVDLVLRAHFRIGLEAGRATVEAGTWIELTAEGFAGSIVAVRSLTTEIEMVDDGSEPGDDGIYDVPTSRHELALRFLIDSYLARAFQDLR